VKRFDAVLFDAGETLLHPDPSFPELIARFVRERGHDVDADAVIEAEGVLAASVRNRFVTGAGWSLSTESSREHWTGVYREFARHLGIDDPGLPDHLFDQFRKPQHYTLFDDALPTLARLKSAGYKIGVVSNFEDWLDGLLTSLEVMPVLDSLVVSGAEGVEKPDPKIFEIALERTGVSAGRAVYVGDSPDFDVQPARALGMHALLIDRRRRYDADAWPVVRSLTEIPEVIA
jgi:putative hydrolase of the HAD superfamily